MKKQKMFIPALGTEFTTASDWKFPMYHESRNWGLIDYLGVEHKYSYGYGFQRDMAVTEVTLPKGTVLKLSRIYIRNGQKGFDSVTFNASSIGGKKVKGCRFWVKLEDANRMEFESHG